MEKKPPTHDAYAAFRHRDYRSFFLVQLLGTLGSQMVATSVGWLLYERTGQVLTLGLVGLALAVPQYLFFLPAGSIADRHNRKHLFLASQTVLLVASLTLGWIHRQPNLAGSPYLVPVYGCLMLMGTAFAFQIPSKQSLFPHLVPKDAVPNAVTWNSTAFQAAAVSGPVLAGFLLKLMDGSTVFFLDAGISLCVIALVSSFRYRHAATLRRAVDWESLIGGVRFVRGTPLLLAAITLDLFAVLFGGATALLPVFVKDILHRDALALGFLRAAVSLGAILMAVFLAHRPLRRAGRTLLWAVAGFGLVTVVFGFSRNFYLSLSMMFLLGALDSISVILRHTLVQVLTPDGLLGRVQALSFLFIISSNELGAFESGGVAAIFGPVFSVVSGGVMAILVVLWVARQWPALSTLRELKAPAPPDEKGPMDPVSEVSTSGPGL